MIKKALTIAGSDSGGGAGIQADLKTFSAHGVYGMSVITAVTAQNTLEVTAVQDITPDMIQKQIDAVLSDIGADAIKIGMVSRCESITVIAESLSHYNPVNLVLDPVMVSKSGYPLLQPDAIETLKTKLIPLANLVTPNIPEAELITGHKIQTLEDMKNASLKIHEMGPDKVLLKGGHLTGKAIDILYDGLNFTVMEEDRILTNNTHGTGCTLSSAITANLALGLDITTAVKKAKEYITLVIRHSLSIGHGYGPTHHFYELYQKAGLLNHE